MPGRRGHRGRDIRRVGGQGRDHPQKPLGQAEAPADALDPGHQLPTGREADHSAQDEGQRQERVRQGSDDIAASGGGAARRLPGYAAARLGGELVDRVLSALGAERVRRNPRIGAACRLACRLAPAADLELALGLELVADTVQLLEMARAEALILQGRRSAFVSAHATHGWVIDAGGLGL